MGSPCIAFTTATASQFGWGRYLRGRVRAPSISLLTVFYSELKDLPVKRAKVAAMTAIELTVTDPEGLTGTIVYHGQSPCTE